MVSIRIRHVRLFVGVMLTLGGLSNLGETIIGGILLTLAGLLFFNPIREIAIQEIGFSEGTAAAAVWAIVIVFVVTGLMFVPTSDGPASAEIADVPSTTAVSAPSGTKATSSVTTASPTATTASTTQSPTVTTTSSSTTASPTTSPPTTTATSPQTSWTVTIVEVVDGDTMDVRMPDGSIETIRLLGVDTPETSVTQVSPDEWEGIPDSTDGRDWLANWGDKADSYAKDRLAGNEVYIETDPEADRRGYYGRLLVYVSQSESADTSFNMRLLQNGYARYYSSEFTKQSEYQSAESDAQSGNVGIWDYNQPDTQTPTESGGTGSPENVEVADIHADAEGNDHENLNDEYIVLRNTGDSAIDMSGWRLSDEADHTYTFPSFTLDAGTTVTIYTGSGTNTESELYWGSSSAVWNNGGDTIIVTTDDGETVINYEY
jgi:micrococcal nuclease